MPVKKCMAIMMVAAVANASVMDNDDYWDDLDKRSTYYTAIPAGTNQNNSPGFSLSGEYVSIRQEGEEYVNREEQFQWMITSELSTPSGITGSQVLQTWVQFGPDSTTKNYESYTCNYTAGQWEILNYNGPTQFWSPDQNGQTPYTTTEKDRAGAWKLEPTFTTVNGPRYTCAAIRYMLTVRSDIYPYLKADDLVQFRSGYKIFPDANSNTPT